MSAKSERSVWQMKIRNDDNSTKEQLVIKCTRNIMESNNSICMIMEKVSIITETKSRVLLKVN